MRTALAFMLVALGVSAPVFSQSASPDRQFVIDAAIGGMAQVELVKLAAAKSANPGVRAFGQQMVADHTRANDELKRIAALNNVPWPSGVSSADQSTLDRLSSLSGTAFDRAYVEEVARGHQMLIAAFRREADGGTDAAVKAWAVKMIPMLENHLAMIEDLRKSVSS